jgi:hypothetical protein
MVETKIALDRGERGEDVDEVDPDAIDETVSIRDDGEGWVLEDEQNSEDDASKFEPISLV